MSKERNGMITKCLAIAGVLALLAGWIWNAATMSSALNANLKADEATHPKVQQNREDILTMQSDVRYIKLGIGRIEEKLDEK
jgi:hypothetical protein